MRRRFLPPCVPWRPGAVSLAGRSGVLRQRVGRGGLRASRLPPCNRDDVAEHSLACQFRAGAGMRAGAPWMRSSGFVTMAASWSMSRAARLPRPFFMLAQTPGHGPGHSRSRNWRRDRERPGPGHRRGGKGPHAHACASPRWPRWTPRGLTYNWMGQRKSAPGLRVTVTWPRLCAVRTAWAEVRRNGVVPGVKLTSFTAHRPPR